ncbi:DUF1028 domain-containing protein [Halorubrum sp. DTA98]|uniref:DUF1028 domain-containing protein n=1 Tax=Halorubrum sp. DTA98 TaxID=3402163 RepID=UPI003AAEF19A
MTFSICASVDGRHGVAIATKAIAVGSTAPFVCRRGAVCSQAMTNTPIGVRAIDRLSRGEPVTEAVPELLARDDHAEQRQVHGIDRSGTTVTHTGTECEPYADDAVGETYTVAGNMLSGPEVLDRMGTAFESAADRSLDRRLLTALRAGEDAGGDTRGSNAQSAALVVFDPETPRIEHDLRVDEHADAVTELERVHDAAATSGAEWMDEYPTLNLQRYPTIDGDDRYRST